MAQRMVYLTVASMVALGIFLTGYDKVSWVLYLPAASMLFAGITGKCHGLVLWRKVLGARDEPPACCR